MNTPGRWVLRIGGLVLAVLVYTIWKQIDAQLGNGFPSAFLRGAVVFGFIFWMWHATKAAKQSASSTEAAVQPTPAQQLKPVIQGSTDAPEDQHWAAALAELESGGRQPGLWARCFAEAQGNEQIARAKYLTARARQLADVHRAQALKTQQAEEQGKKDAEAARLTEEQRRYDALPKGRCPSCDAVILLSAEECPKCRALFTPESTWKVDPIKGA
jgi:hypothetical protein